MYIYNIYNMQHDGKCWRGLKKTNPLHVASAASFGRRGISSKGGPTSNQNSDHLGSRCVWYYVISSITPTPLWHCFFTWVLLRTLVACLWIRAVKSRWTLAGVAEKAGVAMVRNPSWKFHQIFGVRKFGATKMMVCPYLPGHLEPCKSVNHLF